MEINFPQTKAILSWARFVDEKHSKLATIEKKMNIV